MKTNISFNIFIFVIFQLDTCNGGLFWNEVTDKMFLNALRAVERDLRIFIYPIPPEAQPEKRPPFMEDHFRIQYLYPDYLREMITSESNNSFTRNEQDFRKEIVVVSDPQKANAFIIDNWWFGYGCQTVAEKHLIPIINNVINSYPYYNRSFGSDHFFFAVYDNGPFCNPACHRESGLAVRRLINVSFIGNYGMDTTSFYGKDIECHRPDKDIVVPQLLKEDTYNRLTNHNIYKTKYQQVVRDHDSCFKGRYHGDRGILEVMQKRVAIDYCFHGTENFVSEGELENCMFMYSSCGVACWSLRLYEAIVYHTIPIIVGDGIINAFERFIDWTKFTVKMPSNTYRNETMRNNFRKLLRLESDEFRLLQLKHRDNMTHIGYNESFVLRKRAYMQRAAEWFDFRNVSKPRNAFRLITAEIWCKAMDNIVRAKNPVMNQFCNRKSDSTARLSYFY